MDSESESWSLTTNLSRLPLELTSLSSLSELADSPARLGVPWAVFGAAGLATLAPGVGLSVVSEVFVEDGIRAFKLASRQLEELDRELLS